MDIMNGARRIRGGSLRRGGARAYVVFGFLNEFLHLQSNLSCASAKFGHFRKPEETSSFIVKRIYTYIIKKASFVEIYETIDIAFIRYANLSLLRQLCLLVEWKPIISMI